MHPISALRPVPAGRLRPPRLGPSASCLFLALLAANQAAARQSISLPYLHQGSPMALRFAPVRAYRPPPPPLGKEISATPAPDGATVDPDTTLAAAPIDTGAGTESSAQSPGEAVAAANAAAAMTSVATPSGSSDGAPLLPDTYAPSRPPVRIEDLLPYFLPERPPRSEATYELK